MASNGTIVIAGSLAQKPGHGGHAWGFLQYLLGLRRLGWDVLFLDSLADADAAGPLYVRGLFERFGLGDGFAVLTAADTVGLPRAEVLARVRRSALLLNVMGFLRDEEVLAAAPRRGFLDIDPGVGQMWKAPGLADVFRGHDAFVTIGENVGKPDCPVPTCGLDWVTTPQPVVLDHWPAADGPGTGRFTTVASWRGAYGPVDYGGKTYGLRVHEFRKFADLPRRTGLPFELALDIHPTETRDLALLRDNGWELADPRAAAGDPEAYRDYVRGSMAEFMVAK